MRDGNVQDSRQDLKLGPASKRLPAHERLPVEHPLFRYPPSHNPYWSKIRDQGAVSGMVFTDHETETHRGSWRSRFADASTTETPRRLHVEIGCNAGHVIREWAAANPQDAYIGVDWKFKPISRAAEKAATRGIRNLLVFRANAERLHHVFGPGEIDRLCLYFPDPWPKRAHLKNRFINPHRLRAIAPLLAPGGIFHIKTDHPGYFDWMLRSVAESGCWTILEQTRDLHQGCPDAAKLRIPEVTLFERLFVRDGIPIHSLKLTVQRGHS